MNEQIKELRRQATLVETYTSHDGSVHEGKQVNLEKFAELIVRECVEIVLDSTVEYATRPQIAKELKEHFGVTKDD